MANLTFEEETHTYKIDGVEVPGVTQVLKDAGLSNFDHVPKDRLERSIRFGNAVHKAIELKCKGTLDEESVSEHIKPYLNAWDDFVTRYNYTPILHEYRGCNRSLRVGFTIDNIGTFDNATGIVDVKTGIPKGADIIQACGYGYLYPVKRLMIIYLKDEKFKVLEIKGSERERSERIFLSALALYNFKKQEGLI